MTIANRLLHIQTQVPGSVSLVAVSKTKSAADIEQAIKAGQNVFGENYVQEAIEKIIILNQKYTNLEWHYIGKIQKNKIKDLARHFDWVQTLASEETAKKLNDACEKLQKKINVCIQINISGEGQKNGVDMSDATNISRYIVNFCPFLSLRGLMTIGLAAQDTALLEKMFNDMYQNYVTLKSCYPSIDTLSMGMSHDMEMAIKCGSTMLRIGAAIFGERK